MLPRLPLQLFCRFLHKRYLKLFACTFGLWINRISALLYAAVEATVPFKNGGKTVSTYHVNWILAEQEPSAAENTANAAYSRNVINRYCANCGKVVSFVDSGKVRRNANGKNIHVFAIYKCPKDHTWNKRVTEEFLAATERDGGRPKADSHTEPRPLSMNELRCTGFSTIVIRILAAPTGMRLDQVLAQYLNEYSRSEWQRYIKEGRVLVNENIVKASFALRESVEVSIAL